MFLRVATVGRTREHAVEYKSAGRRSRASANELARNMGMVERRLGRISIQRRINIQLRLYADPGAPSAFNFKIMLKSGLNGKTLSLERSLESYEVEVRLNSI